MQLEEWNPRPVRAPEHSTHCKLTDGPTGETVNRLHVDTPPVTGKNARKKRARREAAKKAQQPLPVRDGMKTARDIIQQELESLARKNSTPAIREKENQLRAKLHSLTQSLDRKRGRSPRERFSPFVPTKNTVVIGGAVNFVMPFGKYKGMKLGEFNDDGYLEWALLQAWVTGFTRGYITEYIDQKAGRENRLLVKPGKAPWLD